MPTRRKILVAGLAALATLPLSHVLSHALAQGSDASVTVVRTLYDSFEQALKAGGTVKARADVIGEPMKAAFDFPAMLRTAAGSRWKEVPEAKQAPLQDAFGRFLVATYATRMTSAKGGKFEVKSPSEARNGGAKLVRTTVTDATGDASPVDFILSDQNRVTDVLLQGTVSEVATYRSGFAEPLKKGADGLLAYLNQQSEGMLAK